MASRLLFWGVCSASTLAGRSWGRPVLHQSESSQGNKSGLLGGLNHANCIQVLGLSFSPRTDSLLLMVRHNISASTISRQGYSPGGVTSNPRGPGVQRIANSSACFAWRSTNCILRPLAMAFGDNNTPLPQRLFRGIFVAS